MENDFKLVWSLKNTTQLPTATLFKIKKSIEEFPSENNLQIKSKNHLTKIFNAKVQDIFEYNIDFMRKTHSVHEIITIGSNLDFQELDNTVETLKSKNNTLTFQDIMDALRPLKVEEASTLMFPDTLSLNLGRPRQNPIMIDNPTIPGIYILSKLGVPYFVTYNNL